MNSGDIMTEIEKLKTGTTTVGIRTKDAVVLASESKSTMGYLVASKTAQKIYPVDDRMALTIAGSSGDALTVVRILRAEIALYKLENNEITVNAAASLLSNILQSNRYFPYYVGLILGGYDSNGPHIFSIDAIGGMDEDKKFTSTGSGSPIALGVLENGYDEKLSKQEAIKLAVNAIKAAAQRDVFSGGEEIRVAVITEKGLEFVNVNKK